MNPCSTTHVSLQQTEIARRRLLSERHEPAFYADWMRVLFIHFAVDAATLQLHVPFELDVYEGEAFVSLVAFRMENLRPRLGGQLLAPIFRPFTTHDFLNLRTYVRDRNEPGIYFISELVSNPLAVPLGPPLYGLPYHYARLQYRYNEAACNISGEATKGSMSFAYSGRLPRQAFAPVRVGSLEEFVLERYTAFTCWRQHRRFFRIWHEPWLQVPVSITIADDELLRKRWPWLAEAKLILANFSPGLREIWMGLPHSIP